MPGLLDFGNDELPSLLGGGNSIIWGNRMRGNQASDGLPALMQSFGHLSASPTSAPAQSPMPRPAGPMPLPAPNPSRAMPAPPAQMPTGGGLLGNFEEPQQGLLAGIHDAFFNPMTLTGLGLLTGEGFGGAMRGAQMGITYQDQQRKKAEQQRLNAASQSFFADPANLEGLPPGAVAGLRSLGPDGLKAAIDTLTKNHVTPLDRQYRESQIAANNARAGYYRDGGADRTGQTERIIDRLMQSNPNLSYEEAVALARRAPQDDSMRLENLAMNAYRNDPSRELEEWRSFYGLSPRAATPSTPAATPPSSPVPGAPPPGGQSPGATSAPRGGSGAQQALARARQAIQSGAPRDVVIQRLRAAGIDPSGL